MNYDEMHQRVVIAMLPRAVPEAYKAASVDASEVAERVVYASLAWADLVVEAYKRRDDEAALAVPCTVLDPFMGSGTTGAVCKQLGLEFVGIELNSDYTKLARRRIASAKRV